VRLARERAELTARINAEKDPIVRQHLGDARAALDRQAAQRSELMTAASRLEAEQMRLHYTLEALYTQVLRVRTADAASAKGAGDGLRESITQLSTELDAVAESLEALQSPVAPLSSEEPTRAPDRSRESS
jgi:hypothetical protein